MIHIVCEKAEDVLKIVISKILRKSVRGVCQTPTHNVPFLKVKDKKCLWGARTNTEKQYHTVITLILDTCSCERILQLH